LEEPVEFIPTKCAICGTSGNSKKVYSANLDEKTFSIEVFSARRLPDRRHYQWVRCNVCELLRSDPILSVNLADLYGKSTFDYSSEVFGLQRSYVSVTKKALSPRKPSGSVLEIGGGNGFFLEAALDAGFSSAHAVEPSIEAVAASRVDIKENTIIDMMRPGLIPDNCHDVVAMFHVMDHLPDPLDTVKTCVASLKPGGTFVVAVHNFNSWSSRLLKEKSPIVDVEHTFLYTKKTASRLFAAAGLVNVRTGHYRNLYSLAYLVHLIPLPSRLKHAILNGALAKPLQKIKVSVPLGNMWVSGQKRL
jgi:2-polyprenyl-3-methyl-5-hydroxy-6-metoxy-1,4-benzoquinol methylase